MATGCLITGPVNICPRMARAFRIFASVFGGDAKRHCAWAGYIDCGSWRVVAGSAGICSTKVADAPAAECFADAGGAEWQCVGLQSAWRWVIHRIESAADGAQIRNVDLSLFLTMVLS